MLPDFQPLNLRISALAHDGRGIGFLDPVAGKRGKAVFVAGALPGQSALCRATRDKGAWLEAELLEITDPGDNICQPVCGHWQVCGGCPLQTMPYASQLRWKESIALDAMRRLGGLRDVEQKWQGIIPSPELTGFRNKIELAFGKDAGGQTTLGFRRRGSHEVFTPDSCGLVDKAAMDIAASMRDIAADSGIRASFWRFLVLRNGLGENGKKGWRAICITFPGGKTEREAVKAAGRNLLGQCPDLAAFIHEERRDASMFAKGEKRVVCLDGSGADNASAAIMRLPLGGKLFKMDVASFFQVNGSASEKLAQLAIKMDSQCQSRESLLDAYCGVGAPGLLLAGNYKMAAGIEYDPVACSMARDNARRIAACHYHAGQTGKILEKLKNRNFSTVLADPPRQGLEKKAMRGLLELLPQNIIYISCNPATLARDSRFLSGHYTLSGLGAADLFPHTAHVECCSLWTRKPC